MIFKILTWDEPSQSLLITLTGTVRPSRKENIMYEDEKIIFIDTDTLTMEEHYQEFCDEVWYIHTDEEIRIQRLMKNRGYTREKSLGIIGNQASEEYFRAHTDFVVENNGNVEKTWKQIDEGVRRNETL